LALPPGSELRDNNHRDIVILKVASQEADEGVREVLGAIIFYRGNEDGKTHSH
jgi:hypothetical protein